MSDSLLDKQIEAAKEEWLEAWKTGPMRTRWTQLPLQVDDPAPNFELVDQTGKLVQLRDFWKDQPALILFWRHYGCGCGTDRAARLKTELDDYQKVGSNVVIIGQGEPERTSASVAKYDLPSSVSVLCDPEFNVYKAFGLLDGKPSQIVYDAPDEYMRCDLEAGKQLAQDRANDGRPLVDSSWLMPGEFVVDSSGVVRLTYRYNYCDNFPDHRVLVAALREAKGDFDSHI